MSIKPLQVSGQVDNQGTLQLAGVPALPIGEHVEVLILEQTDIKAIGQMIELIASLDDVDPVLLEQIEVIGHIGPPGFVSYSSFAIERNVFEFGA